MATEEQRAEFGYLLGAAHRRYDEEKIRQYEIYKRVCEREREARDRELAMVDPADRATIALAHERYDKAVDRQGHIYDGYERRAWAQYEATTAELRSKYGITEVGE